VCDRNTGRGVAFVAAVVNDGRAATAMTILLNYYYCNNDIIRAACAPKIKI